MCSQPLTCIHLCKCKYACMQLYISLSSVLSLSLCVTIISVVCFETRVPGVAYNSVYSTTFLQYTVFSGYGLIEPYGPIRACNQERSQARPLWASLHITGTTPALTNSQNQLQSVSPRNMLAACWGTDRLWSSFKVETRSSVVKCEDLDYVVGAFDRVWGIWGSWMVTVVEMEHRRVTSIWELLLWHRIW